jgi:acetyltransferase-like isoleucine patch superfamily enzyme
MTVKVIIVLLPWPLKRFALQRLFGFQLAPTARIGFSWIYPSNLRMAAGSRIESLAVAVNLDFLELGEQASIGRSNWITGFPTGIASQHYVHQTNRCAELCLGDHSAITKHHHIDATNRITIGAYTIIAGYRSQILTHSIDLENNRQNSEPISIGSYCFVGTNCVILGGSVLPDHSVLGALSLLNKPFCDPWCLYAGQPAQLRKRIDQQAAFFSRLTGYVF